jgi:hypothetical protein
MRLAQGPAKCRYVALVIILFIFVLFESQHKRCMMILFLLNKIMIFKVIIGYNYWSNFLL